MRQALSKLRGAPPPPHLVMHHRVKLLGPPRSRFCSELGRVPPKRSSVPQNKNSLSLSLSLPLDALRVSQVVLEFDHYCVFMRRSVARETYGAFLATVLTSCVACLALTAALALRAAASPNRQGIAAYALAAYFGFFALSWLQLLATHVIMAARGLTTHELMQLHYGRIPFATFFKPASRLSLSRLSLSRVPL